MLDAAMNLTAALTAKSGLNDDELATYRALLAHVEMQLRLATFVIRKQAVEEGMSEDDIEGFTPAEYR